MSQPQASVRGQGGFGSPFRDGKLCKRERGQGFGDLRIIEINYCNYIRDEFIL